MSGHATLPEQTTQSHAPAEQGGAGHHAPTEPLFDRATIEEFSAEDREAGTAIGKMLALFFLYTVVVMSFVAWWTFGSVGE